jgi:hypothetical protein
MAQPPEQHEAKPAEQHEPEQARQTATLNGKVRTDVAAAWNEFMRLGNEPAPRVVLRSMPPPPRTARGRAPRMASNARTRGSRRSSAASRGSPSSDDPEPPSPPRASPPRPPKKPPRKLGNPGRKDVRPRSARVRGGRR